MPDFAGSICGVCDCNGFMLLGFFIGVIFGVMVNVVLDAIAKKKAEKRFDPPE